MTRPLTSPLTSLITSPAGLLLALFAPFCFADLEVKPGKWEFTSTTSMSAMPQPRTHVNTECLTQSKISPETLMKDMNQGCKLLDSSSSGSSMSWKVSCSNQGGEMLGEGSVTSGGDTLTGGMNMSMSFNGQSMDMQVSWAGKHLGPCN